MRRVQMVKESGRGGICPGSSGTAGKAVRRKREGLWGIEVLNEPVTRTDVEADGRARPLSPAEPSMAEGQGASFRGISGDFI